MAAARVAHMTTATTAGTKRKRTAIEIGLETLYKEQERGLNALASATDADLGQRRADVLHRRITEPVAPAAPGIGAGGDAGRRTLAQLEAAVDKLEATWGTADYAELAPRFGDDNADAETMQLKEAEYMSMALQVIVESQGLMPAQPELTSRAVRLLERIHYSHKMVVSSWRLRTSLNPNWDSRFNTDHEHLTRFCARDYSKDDEEPGVRLLNHVLDNFRELGYRRHQGHVYGPRLTREGFPMHYFGLIDRIQPAAERFCSSETAYDNWVAYNTGNNKRHLLDNLTAHREARFPDLVRDRHVSAFRNGVYNASTDSFHPHVPGADPAADAAAALKPALPSDTAACCYHDMEFPAAVREAATWRDIATPEFDGVLACQGFAPDVCQWMMIMIGRLIYRVGELDNWQVIPMLIGNAGTGKSTVVKLATLMFERLDIGVIPNRGELIFGLANLLDKMVFIVEDIKKDFNMDQSTFQTLVSGGLVSIPVKNKNAVMTTWDMPGIIAGNELPAYTDASGSIARRYMVFSFVREITKVDNDLPQRLHLEMPALIRKCNLAYREAVRTHRSAGIWSIVPKYFVATQREVLTDANSLESFLESSSVAFPEKDAKGNFTETMYVLEAEFLAEYKGYCALMSIQPLPWNKKAHSLPFKRRGIEVRPGQFRTYPPHSETQVHGTFYENICLTRPE